MIGTALDNKLSESTYGRGEERAAQLHGWSRGQYRPRRSETGLGLNRSLLSEFRTILPLQPPIWCDTDVSSFQRIFPKDDDLIR